ncbi:HAMP domain-containing histidine kinase [Mucilaginibacter sp. RS28]|uniref:histidine kinase n=1 Tax=Mucilaginibacter straminoryzae TaxID=2932774 RepID=A0A9X1X520_9SPHI|nr:HAMP domain-containing sensor histidine kinase [Mucilaginibacter straminoryzae]MCJ8211179.1 HAMP domain-containing histidine kinase [Mucilaginibacter straminoryzae]
MYEIAKINLDNELDLPFIQKRAVAIARYLGLSGSTQTTFATAVTEACRAVLDKTYNSILRFSIVKAEARWVLSAEIVTDAKFTENSEELKYAKRLIPVLEVERQQPDNFLLKLKLSIPRSIRVSIAIISRLAEHIAAMNTESPYEEIKRRNQELFELTAHQEEQLRLSMLLNEKKSEFLSIASHELRSPLTIIKAYAQIGRTFAEKDPYKMADYLDKINIQAGKVNTLIQQLLDFAKIENNKLEYQFEKSEVTGFIEEVVEAAKLSHPSHTFTLNFDKQADTRFDKLRLEQALTNLISNAVKYSPKGTNVTVSTLNRNHEAVNISVADQGIGLSKENLTKVFDKFYRVDDRNQKVSGLGMGLYITSRIIQGHGGEIWVDSIENEGSTFSFSLPMKA